MVRLRSVCLLSSFSIKKQYFYSIHIGLTLVCVVLGISAQDIHPLQTRRFLSHVISPVSNLARYLGNETGLLVLKMEYYNITTGTRKSWIVSSRPVNVPKNRYSDLLAYDDTRVVLDPLPNVPDSDYINANYMDGYHRDKEYVATQGPLPNTINDFWRMIWQLNTRKIIMLANLSENGQVKVAKYWPDTNDTYGEFEITKLAEHNIPIANQVLRKFSLKKRDIDDEIRVIRHFHFTGWADIGNPNRRRSVVSMVQQARTGNTMPMVVHCSTGVGRTGTVILTDSMLQRARAENNVDFLMRLNHMRDHRIDVVDSEGQYIFAHQAVNEAMNDPTTSKFFDFINRQYKAFDEIDYKNNIMFEPLTVNFVTSSASSIPNHLQQIAHWFFPVFF